MHTTPPFTTDDERWEAVTTQDSGAAGIFYYAVRTTGIFCHPGCASRLPKRANVEYFTSAKEAEQAGYRPCKRCAPHNTSASSGIEEKIIDACRYIEGCDTPPKLKELAARANLSAYHFHRLFTKMVGITPKQYSINQQSRKFRLSLDSGESVTEAIYTAGFSSSSAIYHEHHDRLAMQPRQYRSGAAGIRIGYGIARCTLGWVIVAATERGICAIMFDDGPGDLPRQVQQRFPGAQLQLAGPDFDALLAEVVRLVENPRSSILPLDIQGTAFQQKVWQVLRQIKPGQTVSYSEVAERIGQPKAVRAVASACGQNPIAVAIPCHRVVARDGKLAGYRWGLTRKQQLLANEREEE